MKAALLGKVADPSYGIKCVSLQKQGVHRAQTRAEAEELTGAPMSWLIESLNSMKLGARRESATAT